MKVDDAAKEFKEGSPNSVKEAVLRFFNDHPDEVFRRREVVIALQGKFKSTNSIRALIRKLYEERLIDREQRTTPSGSKIGYYGTKKAVEELRQRIGR